MLDNPDHDTLLQEGLATLDRPKRVAFAASCTERLIPCYMAFSFEQGWGRYQLLRDTLDTVWTSLGGTLPDQRYVARASRACERESPDPDEHKSLLTIVSQCAVDALLNTLSACVDDDPSHAFSAAQAVIDAIDGYLISVGNPSTGYMASSSNNFSGAQHERIVELARARSLKPKLWQTKYINGYWMRH